MPQFSRRHVLAALAASLATPPLSALAATATGPVPTLSDGGYVIYFRHGATTWSGVDRIEWPRSRQRLLSDLGIQQSEEIGKAFTARGIPVGEVLASPFARCADMARIAFGRVEERMELIGLLSDSEGRPDRIAYLEEKVVTPPEAGTNRIIISHRSNIGAVADVSLAEGEAVVLRPDGAGGFEVVTTLMPGDWQS